ncbi:MAG: site-specific DNA-methyltransferase, partial [Clostridia bacterium]|nr:site-specific DNA-methyltransferase [Clostridia bacterium]
VTTEGQTVLDPFAGSGTTCIAAQRLNRHYIGIEINEENFKIANSRLNDSYQTKLDI